MSRLGSLYINLGEPEGEMPGCCETADWAAGYIEELQTELNEQTRLLGMSAERELKLAAEIERQKARYALLEESYSLLRTEIESMKRQKPAAWMCPDDPDSATAFSWKPVACELASCLKRRVPLYLAPGAQGVPSVPKWVSTKDKPHPDKPGLESYEHVPCLIVKSGEIMLRQWNCEHLVWDTEDGDDFYCSARDVTHWMPIQTPPSAQENNDG